MKKNRHLVILREMGHKEIEFEEMVALQVQKEEHCYSFWTNQSH